MHAFKVVVLGLGRIGRIHAKNLQTLFPELALQVITSSETGRAFAEKNHFLEVGDDFEQALKDPEVGAVVICSPSNTHAHYIKKSAEAGKAIFCEKPLDLSLKVIREIDAMLKATGVPLMLGFNKRFDPHLGALKIALQAGKIGRPTVLKITSRDPAPPPISYIKSSGGIYMDMIIHDFDTARFLIESEVVSVFTRATVQVDPAIGAAGDVDTSISVLTFENGVMATIDNSRQAAYGYDQRVEILGTGGMLQMNNIPLNTHQLFNETGAHQPPYLDFFLERYAAAYRAEMQAFIQALRQDQPMPVGVTDGLQSTAIAIAAKRSLDENRMVEMREIV
jgi:myo-inositol 2-dehydrogenase/D-chiro-inositol 1-dehydrogenase